MARPTLRSAIDRIKAGDKDGARQILVSILKESPDHEVAFFWYLDTIASNNDRIQALEIFLKRNPDNKKAHAILTGLREKAPPQEDITEPAEQLSQPEQIIEPAAQPPQPIESPTRPLRPTDLAPSAYSEGVYEPLEELDSLDTEYDDLYRPTPHDIDALTSGPSRRPFAARLQNKEVSPRARLVRIVVLVLLLTVCCGAITIPRLLNSAWVLSPETMYAREMESTVELIDRYVLGPVNDWSVLLEQRVYPDQNATYKDVLFYNMKLGYSDAFMENALLSPATEIHFRGKEILASMAAIEPPGAIAEAHGQVLACVKYEVEWSEAIIEFLKTSSAPDLPEDQCRTFSSAYDSLRRYVNENK